MHFLRAWLKKGDFKYGNHHKYQVYLRTEIFRPHRLSEIVKGFNILTTIAYVGNTNINQDYCTILSP